MIQVYTGNGKGKTTAAMGLAMRAAGHGQKVRIIQFMKGSTYTGELTSAIKLGIEILQFGRTCPHAAVIKSGYMTCQQCGACFVGKTGVTEWDLQKTELAWQLAQATVTKEEAQLLILDEIMAALKYELLSLKEVIIWLHGLKAKTSVEIILTGRNAPTEIIDLADLVTEMREIKHPMEQGVAARRCIEY